MTDTIPPPDLDRGETLVRTIRSDRARYLRDHGVMAVIGMAAVGGVLAAIGNDHVAIGALGAVLAIAARGAFLMSEQLGQRWWLTTRRVILPGPRTVHLAELEAVRKILGDVQLVTKGGDKHLIKHVAAPEALIAEILAARDKRLKARG
jgi:hypothetical protein